MSWGYPCSSSILMGYSIINHPAIGGTTILGSLHMTKNHEILAMEEWVHRHSLDFRSLHVHFGEITGCFFMVSDSIHDTSVSTNQRQGWKWETTMYFYAFLCVSVFLVSTWDVLVGYVDMLTLEPISRSFRGLLWADGHRHQNFP